MSLDKKGFAEIVESAIIEMKYIINHNRYHIENGNLSNLKTNFKIPTRKIGLCINKKIIDDPIIKKFTIYIKK